MASRATSEQPISAATHMSLTLDACIHLVTERVGSHGVCRNCLVLLAQQIGPVGIVDDRLEVLILLLQVLAHLEQLATLVLPEVALQVFAFECAHLNAESLETIVRLQLELALLGKLFSQFCNLATSLLLHCLNILALAGFLRLSQQSDPVVPGLQLSQNLV